MVSATQFVTWTACLLLGAILIAATPGLAALVPIAVLGIVWEIRHQLVKRQMRAELRQIVNTDD